MRFGAVNGPLHADQLAYPVAPARSWLTHSVQCYADRLNSTCRARVARIHGRDDHWYTFVRTYNSAEPAFITGHPSKGRALAEALRAVGA